MGGNTAEPDVRPLRISIRAGVSHREMKLAASRIVIGRAAPGQEDPPQIDLSPDDSVSRRHAEIQWVGEGYSILDLESTNGTWVNGKRIAPGQPVRLKDGDHVAVGRLSVLTVHLTGGQDAGSPKAV